MRKNERQELPTTGDKGQAEAAASGETKQTPEARDQGIVRTSIIGIIGNLFLVVFKGLSDSLPIPSQFYLTPSII